MRDAVREFWDRFSPDRLDRAVTRLGREPALVRAAEVAAPLLARCSTVAADFGCGTGQLALHAGTRRIIGIERAPALAARAATCMHEVAVADLRQLPFPDQVFNLGFLLFVLDDYRDKHRIVSEVVRTLRHAGTLVLAAYSPADQHMGYLGSSGRIRPQAGILRVWLQDAPALGRLLRQYRCRVTHTEHISSSYHVDADQFADRVARRQGVSPATARRLVRHANITDTVRRQFILLTAVKR